MSEALREKPAAGEHAPVLRVKWIPVQLPPAEARAAWERLAAALRRATAKR